EAPAPLPAAELGDSDHLRVGQWAIAIGNPFGLDRTVTVGIISATARNRVGVATYENFIQTDASINPGNSGGPLLNLDGKVIGINTAIVAAGQGIGFSIPINQAKEVMRQLIASGRVVRGWLGIAIQDVTDELAGTFGVREGVLVAEVMTGRPSSASRSRPGCSSPMSWPAARPTRPASAAATSSSRSARSPSPIPPRSSVRSRSSSQGTASSSSSSARRAAGAPNTS